MRWQHILTCFETEGYQQSCKLRKKWVTILSGLWTHKLFASSLDHLQCCFLNFAHPFEVGIAQPLKFNGEVNNRATLLYFLLFQFLWGQSEWQKSMTRAPRKNKCQPQSSACAHFFASPSKAMNIILVYSSLHYYKGCFICSKSFASCNRLTSFVTAIISFWSSFSSWVVLQGFPTPLNAKYIWRQKRVYMCVQVNVNRVS